MRLLYKICVNQDSFDKTGLLQIMTSSSVIIPIHKGGCMCQYVCFFTSGLHI